VKIETLRTAILDDLRLVIKALVPFGQQLFAVCIDDSYHRRQIHRPILTPIRVIRTTVRRQESSALAR